jgi:hypothetical protein
LKTAARRIQWLSINSEVASSGGSRNTGTAIPRNWNIGWRAIAAFYFRA